MSVSSIFLRISILFSKKQLTPVYSPVIKYILHLKIGHLNNLFLKTVTTIMIL